MTEAITPRPNADLMAAYMADDVAQVWIWNAEDRVWVNSTPTHLSRWTGEKFAVARERPTEPPVIMCELAGVRFPMPIREAPNIADKYWVLSDYGSPVASLWSGLANERDALDNGFLQATKEGSEQMATAINAAIKRAMDEAKEWSPSPNSHGCTRSHPHELMSPSCRIRTVIAEMRNLEAQGAEVTAHTIGGWADYLASVLDELHSSAQARDADRWRYVSRFMRLDDVGDDQFCLGLVVDSEGLEDRVSAQAARLHHEKSVREWEDVNGPEDEPKTLPQVDLGSAVDAAIDADGRMPLGEVGK